MKEKQSNFSAALTSKGSTDALSEKSDNPPHYEVPNLTSMLYEYTNREQEIIRYAFRVGNFTSLRDLPVNVGAGTVLQAQRDKQDLNIALKPPDDRPKYMELHGGGVFQKFLWMPDEYDRHLETMKLERRTQVEKQMKVHGDIPFYVGTDFKKMSYEPQFGKFSIEETKSVHPFF